MADKTFLPHRSHIIEVKIKGEYLKDYQIRSVRISSTLASYCPSVELQLAMSSAQIIQDKLYGQDPIFLSIRLLGQDASELESHDFELLCTRMTYGSPVTVALSDGKQEERGIVNISAVIKEPFVSMTTLVNGVYGGKESPKTVKEVIEDLAGNTSASIEYDTEGENTEAIDQICVPPRTLYESILYLDDTFGTHDGVPAVFCRYDNSLHIINLSKRIKKGEVIKVSQPAIDKKDDSVEKKSMDGKHFYINGEFKHDFVGNSKFGAIATSLTHVVKPADTLFHLVEQTIDGVCSDHGVIFKNDEFYVDPAINRTKVLENHTGYEYTESFANSMMAKQIFNMSSVSFSLGGNIIIDNFLKVGDPIYIDPLVIEYLDFSGKYILYKSTITYNKVEEGDWTAAISAEAVRTNKTI